MFGRIFKDIDGLTRDDVHDALGREPVPNKMDQIRAMRFLFNSTADVTIPRYTGTTFRTENNEKPVLGYGEDWSEEDRARFKAASSMYKFSYRANGNNKPITAFLDIQLCLLDDAGFDRPVANIGIDFRNRSNMTVFNLYLENVGIADPATREEALSALTVVGRHMDAVDKGQRINPHAFRKDLLAAGLKSMGTVDQALDDLWRNRPTRMTEKQIREQDDRVKKVARRRSRQTP